MNRRRALAVLSGAVFPTTAFGIARSAGPADPAQSMQAASMRATKWPNGAATGLFIGVSRYQNLPKLQSAVPDAVALARRCASLGIKSRLLLNPTHQQLVDAVDAFAGLSENAKLCVIYVAGHGLRIGQGHGLLPVDSRIGLASDAMVSENSLSAALSVPLKQRVIFFDACRDASAAAGAGPVLSDRPAVSPPPATLAGQHVLYASQAGAPAFDGANGHSPFATALLANLAKPGLDVDALSRKVRLDVIRRTKGLQIPWSASSLLSPVILNPDTSRKL